LRLIGAHPCRLAQVVHPDHAGIGISISGKKSEEKKMKSYFVLFGAVMLILGLCINANATVITFDYGTNGNEFISPYAAVTTETFESSLLWTWTGQSAVTSGTSSYAAAPYGVSAADASHYVTVPVNSSSGYVDVDVQGTYDYLGLWWGSIDSYNTISFYKDGTLVEQFTGSQIVDPANGNQTDHATNRYVNFVGLPEFDSFRMTSTQYAFEADNIAVGNVAVPEPFTLLFLGSGLIGIGMAARRFGR
jgi:hypothetical protein